MQLVGCKMVDKNLGYVKSDYSLLPERNSFTGKGGDDVDNQSHIL